MAQTAVENIIEKLKEQIRKSAHNKLGTNRTGDYRIGLIKAIGLCKQAKEMEKDTVKAKEETLAAEISLRIDGVLTRFIHEDEYKSMIDAYEKEVKELHDRIRNQSKIIKDSMDILGKINSLIK
jgi:Mg2+ and Co2+ transporter CorA